MVEKYWGGFRILRSWGTDPIRQQQFCQISQQKPYEIEKILVLFPFRETLLVESLVESKDGCPPSSPKEKNWS